MIWIARASVLAIAVTAVVGCSEQDGAQSPAAKDEDIFGGVRDDDSTSRPAVVALRVKRAASYELCSGALVAPNVVLTARHCVAQILTTSVRCNEDGKSATGMQHFTADEPAANIGIFLGASPSFTRAPASVGKSLVVPPGDVLCNADIALIVLEKPIAGVTPFAVRMSANARIGESIRAVGYGANDAKVPMGTRFRREQVPVLAVGRGVSDSNTRLGPNEFEVGRSICEGDSGGPAISEATGAVIGVVSRGGDCTDDYGHVYTATAGFKDLFDRAFAEAEAKPILETNTPPENIEPERKTSSNASGGAGEGAGKAKDPTEPSPQGCTSAPVRMGMPLGTRIGMRGDTAASTFIVALAAIAIVTRRRRSSAPRER